MDDETVGEAAAAGRRTGTLPALAREVEDFVSEAGWDQPPQLFALVATTDLLAREPSLATGVDVDSAFTPVAQDPLPPGELDEALAEIAWPEAVSGCALSQEIIVLPPDAERELAAPVGGGAGTTHADNDAQMRTVAADHPDRREARIVAAVLRDGSCACVLRLRATENEPEQRVEHPELAPNLTAALLATLETG